MVSLLILLFGIVILILGADKLVEGASSLASKLGIPNIVIGLTIVAFGTSAPELVVNVFAAVDDKTEIVLGNILGSNIFNVLAILGICAIIYPLTVKNNTTWIEIPLSLLAAVAVYIITNDVLFDQAGSNLITRTDGLILLLFFAIFLVYNITLSIKSTDNTAIDNKDFTYLKASFFIILGLAGLIVGGKMIVTNAVNIAQLLGLSDRVIGLTIVSIGTSLPELATSLAAVKRKNVDIAIGNVVGSNIFNIFFILGISTVITTVPVQAASFVDIVVNIFAGILLFIFIFTGKGRKLERWEGIIFLAMYVGYLLFVIFNQ